jgi:hypothetical protein
MKRLVVSTLILIALSFAFSRFSGTLPLFTTLPSFQEVERQIGYDFSSLAGSIRFQRPSLSPLSIAFLTIMQAREEAAKSRHDARRENPSK